MERPVSEQTAVALNNPTHPGSLCPQASQAAADPEGGRGTFPTPHAEPLAAFEQVSAL